MRVVVVGATGNVGTSLLKTLVDEPRVESVLGIARRLPELKLPRGWLDLALAVPLLDVSRARSELGWEPRLGGDEALLDLLDGLREGAGMPTSPLDPSTGGPARAAELAGGAGAREE
jgi:UDP-glucose 4-epimerase